MPAAGTPSSSRRRPARTADGNTRTVRGPRHRDPPPVGSRGVEHDRGMSGPAPIEVVHAGADTWPDIERLFGRAGASNGCWCQYWILGAEYARRDRSQNRRDLAGQIRGGGAGLVAHRDGEAVGWGPLHTPHGP